MHKIFLNFSIEVKDSYENNFIAILYYQRFWVLTEYTGHHKNGREHFFLSRDFQIVPQFFLRVLMYLRLLVPKFFSVLARLWIVRHRSAIAE
jgi:hypothetical protein